MTQLHQVFIRGIEAGDGDIQDLQLPDGAVHAARTDHHRIHHFISAKTGEGFEEWANWLRREIRAFQEA